MWKLDALSDIQKKLLEKHIIALVGEIDAEMIKYVRECLLRLRVEESPDRSRGRKESSAGVGGARYQ
jgi:hypothetical protein